MGGQNITVVCARTKTKDKETIFLSLWYKSSVIFTSGGLTECSEEKTVQITILFILWGSQTDLHPVSPLRSHSVYSKNVTLLLSHNTSLVLFFVKCGVLAEALERVLKLWIRLGRDAIFDTLKTECRQKFSRLTCPGVCRHPHYAGTQSMLPALCNPKKYAGRVFCNLFLSKNGKNIMCHFLLVPHTSVSAWLV